MLQAALPPEPGSLPAVFLPPLTHAHKHGRALVDLTTFKGCGLLSATVHLSLVCTVPDLFWHRCVYGRCTPLPCWFCFESSHVCGSPQWHKTHSRFSKGLLNCGQENRLTTHAHLSPCDLQSKRVSFEHDALQKAMKKHFMCLPRKVGSPVSLLASWMKQCLVQCWRNSSVHWLHKMKGMVSDVQEQETTNRMGRLLRCFHSHTYLHPVSL